jgi:transcriptional regulator with XRE-family HTH domain
MDIREVFAINLRKARQAKGLSQEALAHDSAVDRTYISALERGVYAATIDMVERLATVLDVEASALLQRPARSHPKTPDGEAAREVAKPPKRKPGKA